MGLFLMRVITSTKLSSKLKILQKPFALEFLKKLNKFKLFQKFKYYFFQRK